MPRITAQEYALHESKIAHGRSKASHFEDAQNEPYEGLESNLHAQIEADLKNRRWLYVHSRQDKRTTQAKGVTDFIIAAPYGVTYWLEVKRANGKLSTYQNVTKHCLLALGHNHFTVYSFSDYLYAVNQTKFNPQTE